MLMMVC